MNLSFFSFAYKLLGLLVLVFGVHVLALYARQLPMFGAQITLSYVLNFVLALVVFFMVYRASEKQSAQAGFVFVFGSALKFVVFLLVIKPLFKADGEISGLEIASFFVPYVLCLIFEVYTLSKRLNNQ